MTRKKKDPEAGPVNTSAGPVEEPARTHPPDFGSDGNQGRVEGGVVEDLTIVHHGYDYTPGVEEHVDPRKARPAVDPLTGEKTAPGQIG